MKTDGKNEQGEKSFYATHSVASTPGKYSSLVEGLPADFLAISRITQGLVYHYVGDVHRFGFRPPQERMSEIDTRRMEKMLARIIELDSRPLTDARDYQNRLLGCCRDFALIACTILRQQGTPARLRYGFGTYFIENYYMDHVIVEAWNGAEWQRFDPEVAEAGYKLSIPETEFVTGGRAWQMIRSGAADPAKFGIGPDIPHVSGEWFIRGRMLLDIAALNKQELLCWDQWASGQPLETPMTAEDLAFMGRAADLAQMSNVRQIRDLYAMENRLRVPDSVVCFSPAVGPHPVKIEAELTQAR